MARLSDLAVMVTGGAGGLGEAIARRLLAEGSIVVLADRRADRGEAVASELGSRCHFVELDVRDGSAWARAADNAERQAGPISGLVNNAGVFWLGALSAMPEAVLDDVIGTNLTGALLGTKTIAPRIEAAGGGAIVNIASVDGVSAVGDTAAYAAASWGLRGLTRATALELGPVGIRVNTVCPSVGNPQLVTPFFDDPASGPLRRRYEGASLADAGRPRPVTLGDVAAMVAFLLSDDSATCNGADFVVDAGLSAGEVLAQ